MADQNEKLIPRPRAYSHGVPIPPRESIFSLSLKTMATSFYHSAKNLTLLQWVVVITLVLMIIVGTVGQIITLNLWLSKFPQHGALPAVTIVTTSSLWFCLFFNFWLLAYIIKNRPPLRWVIATPAPMLYCILMGFGVAFNGFFLVSATPNVPELLQGMLLSTIMIWTFGFQRLLVKVAHRGGEIWVAVAFACTAGGILLAVSGAFVNTKLTKDVVLWSLIFAGSLIPAALTNVLQARFMHLYTIPKEQLVDASPDEGAEDGCVKLVLLGISCVFQLIFMYIFFPMSAIPWFGGVPTVAEAAQHLGNGYRCTFSETQCPQAWLYAILFCLMYVLVFIASVYLNHYSPTLTAIVQQLSSPATAIVLVIAPNVAPTPHATKAGPAVGSVILVTIGALLYAAWEENARHAAKKYGVDEVDAVYGTTSVLGESKLSSSRRLLGRSFLDVNDEEKGPV